VAENLHHKLVFSLRAQSQHSKSPSQKPKTFLKKPILHRRWPKKSSQPPATGPPPRSNLLPPLGYHFLERPNLSPVLEESVSAPSQGSWRHPPAIDARRQLLQMFADMKEEMAK